MADPTGGAFLGLEKVVDWLWAVAAGTFAWGWKHTHKRVDALRHDVSELRDTKADKSEMDRQRGHVEKIYDRLDQQGRLLSSMDAKLTVVYERYQKGGRK